MLLLAIDVPSPEAVQPAPTVQVNDRIQRYQITGRTSEQLHRQIEELGPVDPATGKRMHGFTKWNVSWSFDYAPGRASCSLTGQEVFVDVVITLPEWVDSIGRSSKLLSDWGNYLQRLEFHEQGHRSVGISAANAVATALERMPPGKSCDGFGDRVNEVAKAALNEYAQADRKYDAETEHGRTQGVLLP